MSKSFATSANLLFLFLFSQSLTVKSQTTSLGKTANGTSVYGIASALGLLHVIRSDVPVVEVYQPPSTQLTQMRSLPVSNQSGLYDMGYLPKANLLVLLNWFDGKNVTVMQMFPPYGISKWQFTTIDTVAAMSVTEGDEFIVITESFSKSVKVFNKDGVMVRQIFLKTTMSPRHTIRTLDNLYAVTFGYERMEPHYVCRFNVLGFVVGTCYGGRPGSSLMQLDVPARMINTKDGGILVADTNNKRILKLNRDFTSAEVILTQQNGINHPYRLAYYEDQKVLYVADNFLDPVTKYSIGGRVLAFQYIL